MIRGWLAAVALALCVVATAGAADAVGSVTVEGSRFYRDGAPWVAEGVTLVGLVSPAGLVANKATYAAARKSFGPGMLGQAKRFGADLVRFQVSQTGLDPKSKGYDAHYRDEVASAVTLARKSGLNVIVSMQWQGVSGKREAGMPSAATLRAWNAILGGFAKDKGVLLEIFNEPELRGIRPNDWAEWQDSMQPLIDGLRAAGSQNVLLVGGAQFARSFIGAPSLSDPLGELGYAVHPYLGEHNQTRGQWEKKFGAFASKHPVMATEFNSSATTAGPSCPSRPRPCSTICTRSGSGWSLGRSTCRT